MIKPTLFKCFVIAIMLCQQLAYIISGQYWFKLNALSHLFLWGLILVSNNRNNSFIRQDKWCITIVYYGIFLAINQFVDELIGDPQKFNFLELTIPITILLHALWKKRTLSKI
jgi:hypothetical protein